MIVLFAASAALAGNVAAYQSCCAAAGEDACPVEVSAIGPGTSSAVEGSATRLSGMWKLSCSAGPSFDDGRTQLVQTSPGDGAVLTLMGPQAIACWDAACAMPPELCVRSFVSGARVVECATGRAASMTSWGTTARAEFTPVLVDGRIVRARAAEPLPTAAPAAAAPARPAVTLASDTPMPNAPPMPCMPNPALREPSKAQVNAGNASAVAGDWNAAVQNYVAAISIDACNPFAWADLGEAFLLAGIPSQARVSLLTATQLMPQHYQAWTNLGLAEEALGRADAAGAAFKAALAAKPDHQPAIDGTSRIGG